MRSFLFAATLLIAVSAIAQDWDYDAGNYSEALKIPR